MSATLQDEWLALALFFVPPAVYLLTAKGWSAKYEAYYQYLSANSRVFFLQGMAKRIVFPLVWSVFFLVTMPLSGFLFWFTVDSVAFPLYFSLGLAFYWISLVLLLGWMRIFFGMQAAKTAFVYTLAADAGVVGFFAVSIIVGCVPAAVMYGIHIAWLVIATMWTGVAAFGVPPYRQQQNDGVYNYLKDAKEEPSSFALSGSQQQQQQVVGSAVVPGVHTVAVVSSYGKRK